MSDEKYVLVTTISHFRLRYAIPLSELQKLNPDLEVDPTWANDSVTMQEVKEFSQLHISEDIVDTRVLTQSEMLAQFREDNPYLSSWTDEKKIEWVNNWRDSV
jgi:hypothetical protein